MFKMSEYDETLTHNNCLSCRHSKRGFGNQTGYLCLNKKKLVAEELPDNSWNWKIPSDSYSCEFFELEFSDETRASENLKFFE